MATDPATIAFLLDQISGAGRVDARKMFGEYGLYCDNKIVGLICDNTLFLKPTPSALALLAHPRYGPPYPGAKPYLVIEAELDDPELLSRLVAAVAQDLPAPKPKAPKRP